MDTLTAAEYLQRARTGIRQAMAQWDPTNLARVEESRELLSAAAGDMHLFEGAVRLGKVPATDELRTTLLGVTQEIAHATRVVDACVAFHRGMAARVGGSAPGYDAQGHVAGESSSFEPEVHA
jgi:hypothetical protein